MTDRALWDRAYILIGWAMPAMSQGPSDQKLVLEQLEAVLDEIQLRGQQLELFTAQIPGPPDETTRGIRGH
jgi:hypothetical protein